MRITDVINHKGSSVVTAGPDQDLAHLVRLLTEHNIGAVVIVHVVRPAFAAARTVVRVGFKQMLCHDLRRWLSC